MQNISEFDRHPMWLRHDRANGGGLEPLEAGEEPEVGTAQPGDDPGSACRETPTGATTGEEALNSTCALRRKPVVPGCAEGWPARVCDPWGRDCPSRSCLQDGALAWRWQVVHDEGVPARSLALSLCLAVALLSAAAFIEAVPRDASVPGLEAATAHIDGALTVGVQRPREAGTTSTRSRPRNLTKRGAP